MKGKVEGKKGCAHSYFVAQAPLALRGAISCDLKSLFGSASKFLETGLSLTPL